MKWITALKSKVQHNLIALLLELKRHRYFLSFPQKYSRKLWRTSENNFLPLNVCKVLLIPIKQEDCILSVTKYKEKNSMENKLQTKEEKSFDWSLVNFNRITRSVPPRRTLLAEYQFKLDVIPTQQHHQPTDRPRGKWESLGQFSRMKNSCQLVRRCGAAAAHSPPLSAPCSEFINDQATVSNGHFERPWLGRRCQSVIHLHTSCPLIGFTNLWRPRKGFLPAAAAQAIIIINCRDRECGITWGQC